MRFVTHDFRPETSIRFVGIAPVSSDRLLPPVYDGLQNSRSPN